MAGGPDFKDRPKPTVPEPEPARVRVQSPIDVAAWEEALGDPNFKTTLDEGLEDLASGRTVTVFGSMAQLAQRMEDRPEEFGSAFVAKPGTEGQRLLQNMAREDIAAGRTMSVEEAQDRLGLPHLQDGNR